MQINAVRAGIKTRLQTITGLRVSDFIPDSVNPPTAVVMFPDEIEYDHAMQRGLDKIILSVVLIVGRMSDRASEVALGSFSDGSGSSSVKAAIEADKTLGGAAKALRVTEATNFGPIEVNGTKYLSCEFRIEVHG